MIAISTVSQKAMIAIKIGDKEDYCALDANAKHSENALPALINLLEKNDLKLKDNDCYSVVIGPGSFTGIRIGIALVKGLIEGEGEDKKVFPLTTFDLMAYSYSKQNPKNSFLCVLNALSGLCFVCEYDKDGNKISDEKMIKKEELDKIDLIKICLEEENITKDCISISSEDLLELSLKKQKEGKFISQKALIPLYLRKSQAEDQLK